jgi:methylthioribose-1-phosphate isomerase
MKVNNQLMRSIWIENENFSEVMIIDQRALPHHLVIESISSPEQMVVAIRDMHVRGAPLIGVSAAWGVVLALQNLSPEVFSSDPNLGWSQIMDKTSELKETRPTAINLMWAVDRMLDWLRAHWAGNEFVRLVAGARELAKKIMDEDVEHCHRIGEHGLSLIKEIHRRKKGVVNILTHCNAGWLACVDYGTATSPMCLAHDSGIPIHVWVDETRPRGQGAKLTAWELGQHGIPHTLIADNTGGHLMQHELVDLVITGADRVTRCGDVANKIGTYLKALAAKDNGIPFFVAIPSSTIDWNLSDGVKEIPIESRNQDEVRYMDGLVLGSDSDRVESVLICPRNTQAVNYGFDVTPSRLISGFITEKGVCPASEEGLCSLFLEEGLR